MAMNFYKILDSGSLNDITKGDIIGEYEITNEVNRYILENDYSVFVDATPNAFVDYLNAHNVLYAVNTFDQTQHVPFQVTDAYNSKRFKTDQYYLFDLSKVDKNAPYPFLHCIKEIELSESDFVAPSITEINYEDDLGFAKMMSLLSDPIAYTTVNYITYLLHSETEKNKSVESEEVFVPKKFDTYNMTSEEKDVLVKEMRNLLEKYYHDTSDYGCRTILEEMLDNKGWLMQAFASHPNYNGNYQIVFSSEKYKSDTNKDAGLNFCEWTDRYQDDICNRIIKRKILNGKTYEEWYDLYREYACKCGASVVYYVIDMGEVHLINYDNYIEYIKKKEYCYQMINSFGENKYTKESMAKWQQYTDLLTWIRYKQEDRLSDKDADLLNNTLPELRAREGQKTTKVVGKIMKYYGFDKFDGYAKAYAKYCDEINVIKITRHTILSCHPCDFLTMSFGNSWSSCHTIDKTNLRRSNGSTYQGMYCSGTLSYMLDGSSFVLYTVDQHYDGDKFWEQDKINRCMFHVGHNKILQGRCYPQSDDCDEAIYTQFRTLVQKTISDIFEIPNQWIIKRNDISSYTRSFGTHYRDYLQSSFRCNLSMWKYSDETEKRYPISIGHDPIDPFSGNEHSSTGSLNCVQYICPKCGSVLDIEDPDYYVYVFDGEYYCEDCVFWCEYHQEYEPIDDKYCHVENYGHICENAYSSGDFFCCEHCDQYYVLDCCYEVYDDDGYVQYVCEQCRDDDYIYVPYLNGYYHYNYTVECRECGRSMDICDVDSDQLESGYILCEECQNEMETLDEAM